jgi:hypothetical protein
MIVSMQLGIGKKNIIVSEIQHQGCAIFALRGIMEVKKVEKKDGAA